MDSWQLWKDAVKEAGACWAVESLIVVLQELGDRGRPEFDIVACDFEDCWEDVERWGGWGVRN